MNAKTTLLFLVCPALCVLWSIAAFADKLPDNSYAILMEGDNCPGVTKDVDYMYRTLVNWSPGDYEDWQVFVIGKNVEHADIKDTPTRANWQAGLLGTSHSMWKADQAYQNLLVYYSGHGNLDDPKPAIPPAETTSTYAAQPTGKHSWLDVNGNGISGWDISDEMFVSDLKDHLTHGLRKINGKPTSCIRELTVVLDSCFAGGFIDDIQDLANNTGNIRTDHFPWLKEITVVTATEWYLLSYGTSSGGSFTTPFLDQLEQDPDLWDAYSEGAKNCKKNPNKPDGGYTPPIGSYVLGTSPYGNAWTSYSYQRPLYWYDSIDPKYDWVCKTNFWYKKDGTWKDKLDTTPKRGHSSHSPTLTYDATSQTLSISEYNIDELYGGGTDYTGDPWLGATVHIDPFTLHGDWGDGGYLFDSTGGMTITKDFWVYNEDIEDWEWQTHTLFTADFEHLLINDIQSETYDSNVYAGICNFWVNLDLPDYSQFAYDYLESLESGDPEKLFPELFISTDGYLSNLSAGFTVDASVQSVEAAGDYCESQCVPEPGTIVLIGCALVVLAGVVRRKMR